MTSARCIANEKRTSAAKAAFQMMGSGTAEAVPLSEAGICDFEGLHGRESEEKADGFAVRKMRELPFDYAQGQEDTFIGCARTRELPIQKQIQTQMRGSLHCATDDETVCRSGRDDAAFGLGRMTQLLVG
jgi:hypothetical protein